MKASVPISLKLIFVTMLCAALGLGGITVMALDFLKSESRTKAFDSNKDLAEILAREILGEFKSDLEKINAMAQTFTDTKSNDGKNKILNLLNSQNTITSFGVYEQNKHNELFFAANQDMLSEFGISQNSLDSQLLPSVIQIASQHTDSVTLVNTSSLIKKPIMTFAFFKNNNLFKSEIRQSTFSQFFIHKEGLGIYIVDGAGNILLSNGQKPEESNSIRATKNIGYGLSVITDQDESEVLRPLEQMQYRALLIGIMALGLTFIITLLFSGHLTRPLLKIYKGFERIRTGHFEVSPDVTNNDEIGALSGAFRKMSSRLQDRERLKNTLTKFSKPEEVEKILSGETKLPIEKKLMTVLICELQSGVDGSSGAEETIKHVNELWSEVTTRINRYLGFVDKINGSFVRAVWGALAQVNDEGSSALAAALEIRKLIRKINEKREGLRLSPFKIGIGIHTGDVVAGHVGTDGRSEYTFVGEGPLYASQVTAATRELNADILISDETFTFIKNKGYIFGPTLTLDSLNGLKVHQVVGRKTHNGVTESELSTSEQETILTGSLPFQREAKTQIQLMAQTQVLNPGPTQISLTPSGSQSAYRFDLSAGTNSTAGFQTPPQPASIPVPQQNSQWQEPQWYLIRNAESGVTEGPFTVNDLRIIAEQPGVVATQCYSYRHGDTMMVPLLQVPGVSRREGRTQMPPINMPLPPEHIQASAKNEDWYVQREDGQVYGPYTFIQLSGYLESGHINRNTYCWRQGMPNWLYAYQVPGLDRRQGGPPPPPIPLPKVG